MEAIYWNVTTAVINTDWTYKINVESNISDLEYRDCTYVQQPWFNTFPKIWDTVLLIIMWQGQYAILGVVSYDAKQYTALEADDLRLESPEIKLQWWNIRLTGWAITANWEDLNIDDIWVS